MTVGKHATDEKRNSCGKKRGTVLAAEARSMALQWLETAEGTESDQLLSEALRSTGVDRGRQDRVFGCLKELRKDKAA
ncbi:MAG TPA: hypothetical protein VGD91_08290 [Trebonia sp.]